MLCFTFCCSSANSDAQNLGIPNTGNAPPPGPPVQIEDCTAQLQGEVVQRSDGRFRIVFTNEGAVVADLVKFRINYGHESLLIRDVGSFAPGTTITHVFRRRGGNVYSIPLLDEAALTCSIESIHFVDNTEWTPGASAAGAPLQAGDANGFLGFQLGQTPAGVIVQFLVPGGPARLAGIRQGDILSAIDEQHVSTPAEAIALIRASKPGTKLAIDVVRDGESVHLTAEVGSRSESSPSSGP